MSIWCSWPQVGYDEFSEEPLRGGEVLTYAQGFGNHFPDSDRTHELPAAVALAHCPVWCVPGREENFDDEVIGPWLRLSVYADAGLSFWTKDSDGEPIREPVNADVVLDENVALRLYHDLGDWLLRTKAQPTSPADDEETIR